MMDLKSRHVSPVRADRPTLRLVAAFVLRLFDLQISEDQCSIISNSIRNANAK